MDDAAFRREYLAEWLEEPGWAEATRLAAEYFIGCEAYDRRVCNGGIHPQMGAMPANGYERLLISRNAQEAWKATQRAALVAGVSGEMLRKAREHVSRYAHHDEMLKRIAERP